MCTILGALYTSIDMSFTYNNNSIDGNNNDRISRYFVNIFIISISTAFIIIIIITENFIFIIIIASAFFIVFLW